MKIKELLNEAIAKHEQEYRTHLINHLVSHIGETGSIAKHSISKDREAGRYDVTLHHKDGSKRIFTQEHTSKEKFDSDKSEHKGWTEYDASRRLPSASRNEIAIKRK